jgi:hypothetical protein
MKISIGSKIVQGPWGGGNLFAINLSNFLLEKGHEVSYDLSNPDLDLILLTDPRSRSESSSTFNHKEIEKYKKHINPNVAVVQRINECDERKNTENINKFYLNASEVADHVVFVSTWLKNIYTDIGMKEEKTSVILAGANKAIFNRNNQSVWNKSEKIKIVTHHWSSHKNKGFEIYKFIDEMVSSDTWKDKIEFTYIGNLNDDYKLYNTNTVEPLAGVNLANELKKHHIYVTASINEPSGNHHIEAAQCGLPILYIESGGIPEYCNEFGISFNDDFEENLNKITNDYDFYINKMAKYPFSADKMCNDFFELFQNLINQKSITKKEFKLGFRGYILIFKNKTSNKIKTNVFSNLQHIFGSYYRRLIKWIS